MPRLSMKTKAARGKEYRCDKCREEIVAGEQYWSWAFRYGGKHHQHVKCGRPRQSQLTQSRLGEIYAAVEEFEDCAADDYAGRADAAEAVVEVTNEVVEAYREAAEAFGGAGENAERADELEGWSSDLEEAAGKFRELADAIEEVEAAAEVISGCPL